MEESYHERFDRSYRNPDVVAAFHQEGTKHPITVIQYERDDEVSLFRIIWNNKRLNHDPFLTKEEAINFIKSNAMVIPWKAAYRPLLT
jgi:hypothetical protein